MKRVITKTETREADGAVTSTYREEESSGSGLLEAWGYLVLMFFTFLLFMATYRVVSSINQQIRSIMAFKRDNKTTAITSSPKGNLTKSEGSPGQLATFKINRESLVSQVLPPGGQGIMEEISKGLGIDILDPKRWTKEQVIAAKKLASMLDEKLIMMQELMPAIMKFLEFQVGQAEFQAEVMSEAYKAKHKIDKAQAKAFVSYYAYMRKASQLEKRVQATQKHIDAAFTHFETIQDSRSNAILAGLNQQSRIGENTIEHQGHMASQRREVRSANAQRRRELREELRTGHLTAN